MAQKGGGRQQPGFACEECRRRKARCDRVRPTCGPCSETERVCITRYKDTQKGRRKSQLDAMRQQIASLQWQLNQLGHENDADRDQEPPQIADTEPPDAAFSNLYEAAYTDVSITTCLSPTTTSLPHELATASTSALVAGSDASLNDHLGWVDWATDLSAVGVGPEPGMADGLADLPLLTPDSDLGSNMKDAKFSPASEPMMLAEVAAPATVVITDDIRADLDQIFIERVHPIVPFVYWRRFLSWADQKNPGPSRVCLRSAMRTMAAAMSASSTRFCDQLYAETCDLLQAFVVRRRDDIAIEYIQAWLLLGHFELFRAGEHQAMLTAGRCCRLVLMARLFQMDHQNGVPVADLSDTSCSFSDVEERRRTFWVAYCLDRLLCSRNEYPLTFQEEMICTRLPAPEANFQNNQPVCTSFLYETIMLSPPASLSPFAECIVLATIHGWCTTYHCSYPTIPCETTQTWKHDTDTGQAITAGAGGGDGDRWGRPRWLASSVEKRLQSLGGAHGPGVSSSSLHDIGRDPMLLLAHMLAHGAVIKLGQAAQQRAASLRTAEHLHAAAPFAQKASSAAVEMALLAKQMPSFGCFKVHPFLPDLLGCAATLFTSSGGGGSSSSSSSRSRSSESMSGGQQLLQVLRDMQGMNSLARDYLQRCVQE